MFHRTRARHLVAATLLAVGAALAACSSGSSGAPQVASLGTSAAAPASGSAQPGDADRPRYKLDMTPEESDAIVAPYLKCMADHGVTSVQDRKLGTTAAHDEPQSTLDAAQKACANKIPLPPWENDPHNPAALDFNRKIVNCLQAKGVRNVQVTQDDTQISVAFSGQVDVNDQQSVSLAMKYTEECQKEIAGGH